jgi:hypothetical protein
MGIWGANDTRFGREPLQVGPVDHPILADFPGRQPPGPAVLPDQGNGDAENSGCLGHGDKVGFNWSVS